jgi:2-polyprenyl-3-methyl-5-hydroxy-6-metoxy-1,4-benzoquinol methylase
MDDIKVTYYGHVHDASGYGQAARAYIHALHAAGISLSVVDLMTHGRQVHDDLVASLLNRRQEPDFHLFHGIPPQWARLAFRLKNTIGMTVWETDTMPSQWRNVLGHTIDLWLPCRFNVETFQRDLQTPIFRLPHAIPPRASNGSSVDADGLIGAAPDDFVFYSMFEWQARKGPLETLRAYLRAFQHDEDVLLALKVNRGAAAAAAKAVDDVRRETGSAARVSILADHWGDAEIDAMHHRGNCYVSLHRGEGWGYPLFDAAARGTPAIATAFSGPLDYLGDNARLVPFRLAPVDQRYVYYGRHMHWAIPDEDAAVEHMREVRCDPAAAQARAADLAARIRASYSLDAIGQKARGRLLDLLERSNKRRWRAVRIRDRGEDGEPPRPVPPEWYDEDYFEHGLTSNWDAGYSWDQLGGVFRSAAEYLVELFPGAQSYLDAGCAKGFLVRCLRAAGKDCWGVDHSPWAIAHADAEAKPFLIEGGVDEVAFDREVDVLVAFDLLSELTEEQALEFLRRARTWTRMAIVAVIPSFESPQEEAAYRPGNNRDRTHVTMRTRAWWDQQFTAAGWRLDALHRLGAERCQSHPLPRRMGWRVYVYAPR